MSLPVAQLSCQNCTRRKTKCDKQLPSCSACAKAGISCTTVQRQRLPRGKSARLAKSSNEQALRDRIDRLEGVVARLQQAQPTLAPTNNHHEQNHSDHTSPPESFVAPDFWAELMESVAGLRSVIEDSEPSESTSDVQKPDVVPQRQESLDLAASDLNSEIVSCDPNNMLFGPASKAGTIDTSPEMSHFLLDVYHKRVHALFMVLHWPSTLDVLQAAGDGEDINVRTLRAAIYFTSICSLFDHELEERRVILNQYRQRAEQAFIDAKLLTTTNFMVLQAFVVYLAGLRACEANAQQWMLISIAIRLASALGLDSSLTSRKLSVFENELRCRLWFCIGVLDLQSAFDRGSRALLKTSDLQERPLDVDDADITPGSVTPPSSRDQFCEMSFAQMTYVAGVCHRGLTEFGLSASNGTENPHTARAKQLATLDGFEAYVIKLQGQCDSTPTTIQAFTMTVAQESLIAMRLLFHRPLHKRGKAAEAFAKGQISNEELLTMATEVLERSQSKRSYAYFAQWAWFKWVKWFALAVVLAELCTAHGSFADHAWAVAQRSYNDYASIVADTKFGLLWRPIARLMQRARSLRTAGKETPGGVASTMNAELINIQKHTNGSGSLSHMDITKTEPSPLDHTSGPTSDVNMSGAFFSENDANDGMSWLYWDLLIDDIETEGLHLEPQ